jgi:hypothetical protein
LEETTTTGTRINAHRRNDFTVPSGTVAGVPGKSGLAVSFDDVGWLRTITTAFAPWQAITISMWVHATSSGATSADEFLGADDAGAVTDYAVRFLGTDKYTAVLFDTAAASVATAQVVGAASTWNHWLVFINPVAKTIKLQVNNGTSATSSALTGTVSTASTRFILIRPDDADPLLVDELGFWGRLLTLDECTALYSAGTGLFY